MCKSGVCEGGCSYEQVTGCPIVEKMVGNFGIPQVTEEVKSVVPSIVRGPAPGTASPFFKTGWTGNR